MYFGNVGLSVAEGGARRMLNNCVIHDVRGPKLDVFYFHYVLEVGPLQEPLGLVQPIVLHDRILSVLPVPPKPLRIHQPDGIAMVILRCSFSEWRDVTSLSLS